MNFTARFLKVWEVEDKGKYISMNLGESKKRKDTGEWQNWTWFNVKFVGNALEKARTVSKDDVIQVTNGLHEKYRYEKDGVVAWGENTVVFNFDFEEGYGGVKDDFNPLDDGNISMSIEDDDSIPF